MDFFWIKLATKYPVQAFIVFKHQQELFVFQRSVPRALHRDGAEAQSHKVNSRGIVLVSHAVGGDWLGTSRVNLLPGATATGFVEIFLTNKDFSILGQLFDTTEAGRLERQQVCHH